MSLAVRPFGPHDVDWAETLIGANLGGRYQARFGELIDAIACPGFVVESYGRRCGIVTYQEDNHSVEVVYIETTLRHLGAGTALMSEVVKRAGTRRLWLVATNDNLDALRFYQRRGFRLAHLRPGAVDEARRGLQPSIPRLGHFGIEVRDELVLEFARIDLTSSAKAATAFTATPDGA
ncbi:MAG TPA: GNAT family N-acetyltransferase [Acidimicrobiales bacterium]|nr:GNAT family N-acetyltransferase [Acidimicrobiales bacterium]